MAVGKTGTLEAGESTDRALIERELTTIVSGLLSELGSVPGRRIVPGDSLDRDLGLGSLERVELLLRIEQAFGVRLADDVMVAADTDRGSRHGGARRLAQDPRAAAARRADAGRGRRRAPLGAEPRRGARVAGRAQPRPDAHLPA